MNEIPTCRHFITCNDIRKLEPQRNYSLIEVIQNVVLLKDEPLPAIREVVCFYCCLTNGRGKHFLRLELVFGVGDDERVDFRSRALEYDFGQDPMMVFGVPFKIRNLLFQDFGQYEVRLFCDDRIIGRDYIEFRGK